MIKCRIGAAREPRDLAKGAARRRISALVEHEGLHPQQAQLARKAAERVDILLHGVPYIDEGAELALLPSLRPWLVSLGKKKPAFWLSIHAPFWLDKDKRQAEIRAAWDVLKLFEFVYDHELRRVFPAKVGSLGE